MKMEYESPVLEIFSFETKDVVMDSCPDCGSYGCPTDGVCIVDYDIPNISVP